jgi:hypothetical protein
MHPIPTWYYRRRLDGDVLPYRRLPPTSTLALRRLAGKATLVANRALPGLALPCTPRLGGTDRIHTAPIRHCRAEPGAYAR